MQIEITPLDQVMARYGNGLAAAGKMAKPIMAMSLNKEGAKGRTDVQRALRIQTGLKLGAIRRAIKQVKAGPRTLTYKLIAQGGFIPLKYFSPKEVKGGVKHTSPNDPNPFRGGFTRVGGWVYDHDKHNGVFRMSARQRTGRFGGHVMRNVQGGKWGGEVEKAMSKTSLPKEMITGQSRAAFNRVGPRVVDEVGRLLMGHLNGTITIKSRGK